MELQQPLIPIIILNWNGIEVTEECLDALAQQSYQNFEIHLVDNGSLKAEKEKLVNLISTNEKVIYYDFKKNHGFAEGCNKVIRELIKSEIYKYVVLLNNDTVPDADWLKELVKASKTRGWDMVASKQLFYEEPQIIDNAGLTLLATTEILPIGAREHAKDYEKPFECLCPSAGAGFYKLEIFKKAGLFDPFFKTCYEDAELGLRAALKGYTCGFWPKAKILHRVSYSVNRIKKDDYGKILQTNMLFAYFGNMPFLFRLLLGNLALIKSILIGLLGIFTFRWSLTKSQWGGWLLFFKYRKTRKQKQKSVKPTLKTAKIWKLHKSFFGFYLKYLNQFIFSGKPTVLE